jgi:hypothetical protein
MKKLKLLFICLLIASFQVFSPSPAYAAMCDNAAPYDVSYAQMCTGSCCFWEYLSQEGDYCYETWCVDYTTCGWHQTEEMCTYYQ